MGHGARGLLGRRRRAGTTSRTTTRAAAPIAGARTACSASRDRECRLCFALALWNGRDPILKERLFGLTGPEGNHGEDVKERYFYLDSTPTHSYMKALYKYPQARVPVRAAGRGEPPPRHGASPSSSSPTPASSTTSRYFDVARRVRQGVARRHPDPHHRRQPRPRGGAARTCCRRSGSATPGPGAARGEGYWPKPQDQQVARRRASRAEHASLGRIRALRPSRPGRRAARAALHRERDQRRAALRRAERDAVREGRLPRLRRRRPRRRGEPGRRRHQGGGALPRSTSRRGGEVVAAPAARRRRRGARRTPFGPDFDARLRRSASARPTRSTPAASPPALDAEERRVVAPGLRRPALVASSSTTTSSRDWLDGDPGAAAAARRRARRGRNARLAAPLQPRRHLDARQVGVPLVRGLGPRVPHDPVRAASIPHFAKEQLVLFLREWYMHPNGQLPGLRVRVRRREPAGARLGRAGASTR